MLYFRIKDEEGSLLYSDMFQKLECLRSEFRNIIEDYSLSETSVDEVVEAIEREHDSSLLRMRLAEQSGILR